ncbi:hypothetical protein LX36DRAFT_678244 [Colletotrichum falcatum]|nr:hypothetical protein LX36DRAFT_678244 [Colletotrichum falcatum]
MQQQKSDEQRRHRKANGEVEQVQPLSPDSLLHQKLYSDRLSPVFSADLCWNACYTVMDNAPHNERVEWPPLAAFKEAGRRIGSKALRRSLPLPRQNQIQAQGQMIQGDGANDETGTMDYHEKTVKLDRLGLFLQQSLIEPELTDNYDIEFESLPAWTREIIAEIELEEEEEEEEEENPTAIQENRDKDEDFFFESNE